MKYLNCDLIIPKNKPHVERAVDKLRFNAVFFYGV